MKISIVLAHLLGTALFARMVDDAPAAASNVNATEVQTAAQEAGAATSGEGSQSSGDPVQSLSASNTAASDSAQNASALAGSDPYAATAPASGLTSDAPAVAVSGESLGSTEPGSPAAQSPSSDAEPSPTNTEGSAVAPTVADLQSELNQANATIAELQAQLAAAQDQTEHPIHTVLSEIEAEIERPGAILKGRVKSLLNDARALF